MAKSVPEMQMEFQKGALKMLPIMANPFKSKGKKRETLCGFVDGLSKDTFTQFIPQIVVIIDMKKKACKEYTDSKAQVVGILEWLPRMKDFEDLLLEVVKQHRQKHGLSN